MPKSLISSFALVGLGLILTLSCQHADPSPLADCHGIEGQGSLLISFWYTPVGPRGIGSAQSTVSLDGRVWNEGILQGGSCNSLSSEALAVVESYVSSQAFLSRFSEFASTPECTDCCYAQLGIEYLGKTVVRDLGSDTKAIEPFIIVLDSMLQEETGAEYFSVGIHLVDFFSCIAAMPASEKPCQNQ